MILFFSFLFGSGKKYPITKICTIENKRRNYKPNKGDKLDAWPKPKSNEVYFYLPKTGGGDGLVGSAFNSKIHRYLNNLDLNVKSSLHSVKGKFLTINVTIDKY